MTPKKKSEPVASGGGDLESLSFEDALARLETIVAGLEEGEIPLEDSVRSYAEGMRLVAQCLKRLETAEATVKELAESAGGFKLSPFDEKRAAGEDDDASGA